MYFIFRNTFAFHIATTDNICVLVYCDDDGADDHNDYDYTIITSIKPINLSYFTIFCAHPGSATC